MAKLFAVLISSPRLFQSRLPLNFNEFFPDLCDLAGGSSRSILILKSYSTNILAKRSHMYGGFNVYLTYEYILLICSSIYSSCAYSMFPSQKFSYRAYLRVGEGGLYAE